MRAGFTLERADDIVSVPAAAVYAGLDRVPITIELAETQLADLLNDNAEVAGPSTEQCSSTRG